MEIKAGIAGNYTELKIVGRLDSNTSLGLEKELIEIIERGDENILINFEDLNYISSSGLRVFLIAAKMLEPKGIKLNFCCLRDFIKEVFDIAGFSSIFNIYDTRTEVPE